MREQNTWWLIIANITRRPGLLFSMQITGCYYAFWARQLVVCSVYFYFMHIVYICTIILPRQRGFRTSDTLNTGPYSLTPRHLSASKLEPGSSVFTEHLLTASLPRYSESRLSSKHRIGQHLDNSKLGTFVLNNKTAQITQEYFVLLPQTHPPLSWAAHILVLRAMALMTRYKSLVFIFIIILLSPCNICFLFAW